MAEEERLRRPEPARDGPRRAFNTKAAGRETRPPGPAEPMTADAIIQDAVESAYRVVEENVKEGRKAAERLRAGVAAGPEEAESTKAVANRLMHLSKELSVTWVELIMAVLRETELRQLLDRIAPGADRSQTASPPADGAGPSRRLIQRVSSRKPIEVSASPLAHGASAAAPAVAGLHALNPEAASLRQVAFSLRPDGALELRIDVPDDQPVGVYSGAVVDPDSLSPLGTLTVRVVE